MSARDEILEAARAAIAVSQDGPAPVPAREYRLSGDHPAGSQAVLDEFVEALEDYGAKVTVLSGEPDSATLCAAVSDQLRDAQARRVVVPAGLDKHVQQACAEDGRQVSVDSITAPLSHYELDDTDAVVTESRCSISLSGTIVLDGTEDQGRRAITLVPDTHVCIVRDHTVMPTVPQAVEILAQHPERPVTWVAGPSATSDIELVRVDGVHGPRNLYVIIVAEDGTSS